MILKFIVMIFAVSTYSIAAELGDISYGKVEQAENRLKLKPNDFTFKLKFNTNQKARAVLKRDSIQWIRTEQVLPVPRARVGLYLVGKAQDYHLRYAGRSLLTQQKGKYAHSEFYVSLFSKEDVEIYKNGNKIGTMQINSKPKKKNAHYIDYSCSRNNVEVKGMDGELMSLGCRTQRIGKFGHEKAMLEVLWSSANFRLLDNSKAPYMAVFMDERPVKLKVIDNKDNIREIEIHAKLPKRLRRLNTAIGFGPYAFETTFRADAADEQEKKTEPIAPALMVYANFKLTEDSSVRGFNAAVWKESVFNNAGLYFANDIAKVFDNKLVFTTLLGMQSLYFKFDMSQNIINEPIFPQGLEFTYKHAFDIENYIISGGLFVSPAETIDYQNIWVRWGQNFFWELNYIYWGKERFSAKMWGLSIGLPFKSFF
ncbi:MAG: DUF1302 family protein [Bacteriovoracaceae bacterium]|nr:DUF1302 family protein [Bacteriovoracaceae bacterium]